MASMFKHLVVVSLKIVLKLTLRLLGVTKKKVVTSAYGKQDSQCTRIDSVKQIYDEYSPSPQKRETRRTGKWNPRKIHVCDESSESDMSFRIPRNPLTPRSRQYFRPATSSPMHVLRRQYSSSSGISTTSDVIITEIDTDDSFPEYNLMLDSVFEKRNATEVENTKLKAALDVLTKEKLQLQDKIIQQHERLLCKKLDAKNGDSAKNSISRACQLRRTSVQNSSMQESASELCKLRKNQTLPNLCKLHCGLNRTVGYCVEKCPDELSSSRRQCEGKSDEHSKEHQLTLTTGIRDKVEILEKIKFLESENIRLREYINGLLYLVLENSPSILETNQEYMYDGRP